MQFYLNGFQPGDLNLSAATFADNAPPAEFDVLIVGCGPAGLMLAAQLARFTEITTPSSGRSSLARLDGIAFRTMEMFEAFGFADRGLKEAYWVNETTFWKPDNAQREAIVRGCGFFSDRAPSMLHAEERQALLAATRKALKWRATDEICVLRDQTYRTNRRTEFGSSDEHLS